MKKTQSKAFASFLISILLLIFEIWAYLQTLGFKIKKNEYVQPATFPQVMIIGMAIFTVVLLVQSALKVFKGMKPDDFENAPAPNMNPVTNRGVGAGYFVILLCIIYVMLFKLLGYVAVSAIICAVIMWLIGKREPVMVIAVSILVPLVMWFVFYKLLQVNIPMGVLQFLRDLVDKIKF